MPAEAAWEPLAPADLPAVLRIAALAHPALPERAEVFAEKLRLFPAGCLRLAAGGELVGYGFSHPWAAGSVPGLDDFLGGLPERPGCLYIHDVALLAAARGAGAAVKYTGLMARLAAEMKLPALALTAVYGTGALWSRFGFRRAEVPGLEAYGPGAEYMTRGV